MMRSVCAVFICATLASLSVQAESAEAAVKRLERFWMENGDGTFSEEFWVFSAGIADEQGIAIIRPIMKRSKKWENEEGLVYVPLIACLPHDEALKVLRRYEAGKDEMLAIWAHEFVVEIQDEEVRKSAAISLEKSRAKKKTPNQSLQTTRLPPDGFGKPT